MPQLNSQVDDIRQISVVPASRRVLYDFQQALFNSTNTEVQNRESGTKKATMHTARVPDQTRPQKSFVFPFTPQQVQYSNMSAEFVEISRPGKTPLVAFNKLKARQISFQFLLAVPLDGLFITIDGSIDFLYDMATSGEVVYFTNMDRQITNPLIANDQQSIFWTITDLSFSSIRRNEFNAITAAEGTITLIENTNPDIAAAPLPRLEYTVDAPQRNRPANGPEALPRGSWTDTLAALRTIV